MKRITIILTVALVLIMSMPIGVYADGINVELNFADATVSISNYDMGYSNYKARVEKDGVKYTYDLVSAVEVLPLQLGVGEHKVTVFGHVGGKKYRSFYSETFFVSPKDNKEFLSSHQTINWNEDSKTTILAKELTKNAKSDLEKLEIIHNYIVTNFSYDDEKAASDLRRYIPNPDKTLEENKGICYDYSSVMAAMLRSVNVPTKLIKGYAEAVNGYHAWNEVLIDGEWIVVDSTTDTSYVLWGMDFSIEKDASTYEAKYMY